MMEKGKGPDRSLAPCASDTVSTVPLPVPDFGHVLAVGGDILLVLHQLVLHELNEEGPPVAQLGQPLYRVDDQIEASMRLSTRMSKGVVMVPSSR